MSSRRKRRVEEKVKVLDSELRLLDLVKKNPEYTNDILALVFYKNKLEIYNSNLEIETSILSKKLEKCKEKYMEIWYKFKDFNEFINKSNDKKES